MSIVEMICRMNEIVTEIRKCEGLYHYCDDSKQIYHHILESIYALQKPDLLFEFAKEDLDEQSNVDLLKEHLLKLYQCWKFEFVDVIGKYHQYVEEAV